MSHVLSRHLLAVTTTLTLAVTALSAQGGGTPPPAGRGGAGGGRGAANNAQFQGKRLPVEKGFRVYVVSNMAGMGGVADYKEIMTGAEAGAPTATATNAYTDYEARFRSLLTQEVNAVIKGARLAGAGSFVVSDAHPGNQFGNILMWELDSGAVLVRGFPRPIFMISGLDSSFNTLMFDGAVAGAGSPGILNHTFGFDAFAVNGKSLNEVAICALIAGEMGVAVSMVAGDDAVIEETKKMLPGGFVPVTTKYALGKLAAMSYSPSKVRQLVSAGAAEAVRRAKTGAFKPFTMDKPYRVTFTLQSAMTDDVVAQIAALPDFKLEKTSPRSFAFTANDARTIGYLIDAIQPRAIR